jgi:hypothetical protein
MNTADMNQAFVIAAYTVMWVVVAGYGVRLMRKGARARADFDGMARGQSGERS